MQNFYIFYIFKVIICILFYFSCYVAYSTSSNTNNLDTQKFYNTSQNNNNTPPNPTNKQDSQPQQYKSYVLSTDLIIQRYVFRTKLKNDLVGNGLRVMIGVGYVAKQWFTKLSYDIYMGPYDKTRPENLPVDFNGSGYSLFFYHTLYPKGVRREDGNFGISLGISQMSLKGSLISQKTYTTDNNTEETIDNYSIKIYGYTATAAMFFCKLLPARIKNNDIKSLTTRIEGIFIMGGISIPLKNQYKAHYIILKPNQNIIYTTQEGSFIGHASFIGVNILLGI